MTTILPASLRSLVRSMRFSLLAITLIGLGVGACTTVFVLYSSVFLQPRPGLLREHELVDIGRSFNGTGFSSFAYIDYADFRRQSRTLAGLTALQLGLTPVGLAAEGDAQPANAQWVAPNYFSVLGTRAVQGRFFSPESAPSPAEIVLSERYWRRRFNADPGIVGRTVLLNSHPVAVIGVAGPGFNGSTLFAADFWMPFPLQSVLDPQSEVLTGRLTATVIGLGRLKPGETAATAQADLNAVAAQFARDYPETHKDYQVRVLPSSRLPGNLQRVTGLFVGLLGLLAALSLLVAAANVAGLLLARGVVRQREFAIRAALGADRRRLFHLVLTENLLLFASGGFAGVLLSSWLVDLFVRLTPQLPFAVELALHLDPLAFGFALALALLVGLGFSFGPAWGSSRFDLLATIRQAEHAGGSPRLSALRNVFLVIQLTVSLSLLVTAGSLARALLSLARVDLGFSTRRVELVQYNLAAAGLNGATAREFNSRLLASARALPGVEHAALTVAVPLDGTSYGFGMLALPARAAQKQYVQTDWNLVSPGYFATLRIPLLVGRDFTDADRPGVRLVGIVNETFARQTWPELRPEEVPGRLLVSHEGKEVEIVGVARDVKYRTPGESPRAHFYAPLAQHYSERLTLLAQGRGEAGVVGDVRALIRRLQPGLPVSHSQNLDSAVSASLLPQRIAACAALTAGLLSLLLAGAGIYAVTVFWTVTRAREYGIRLALGATPTRLLLFALRGCFRLLVLGTALGLVAALGLGLVIGSVFDGMPAFDAPLFAGSSLLFALLVSAAAWLPARRATRVDPMIALRAE